MSEAQNDDDSTFVSRMEDQAWEVLRKEGLSDDEIWNLVIEAVDFDWENIGGASKRDFLGLLLLEIHEFCENINDDNFSQSALDWAVNGFVIAGIATQVGDLGVDAKLRQAIEIRLKGPTRGGAKTAALTKKKNEARNQEIVNYMSMLLNEHRDPRSVNSLAARKFGLSSSQIRKIRAEHK